MTEPLQPRQSSSARLGCDRCDQPTFRPGLCTACAEASEVCEHAGHEWEDAGGGLEMCTVCMVEKWGDETDV